MLVTNLNAISTFGENFATDDTSNISDTSDTSDSSDTSQSSEDTQYSDDTSYDEPYYDDPPQDDYYDDEPYYEDPHPDDDYYEEPPIQEDPEPIEEETTIYTTEETTTVTTIQQSAFLYELKNNEAVIVSCKTPALLDIEVPEYINGFPVTEISATAFIDCINVKEIILPYSIKTIEEGAFKMCHNLEYIGVATENNHYKSSDGVLYSLDGTSIICYPADKQDTSYTIPDSTLYIAKNCFTNNANLQSLILPANIQLIGYSAFNGCISLKNFTVQNDIELTTSMFENCNLETIHGLKNSKAEIYADQYLINFESIGILETTLPTTSATTVETTTTLETTTASKITNIGEDLTYYAPEYDNGTDNTEKLVIVIIAVALISLVVAVASKSSKSNDDDDEDDDEEEDIEEEDE